MPEGIFSPMHILIILVIVAIFFGAKRLPELGKGLGAGIREFKSGLTDLHSDVTVEEPAPVAEPAPAAEQPKLLAAQATPADAAAGTAATDAGPAATDAPASSAATQETL